MNKEPLTLQVMHRLVYMVMMHQLSETQTVTALQILVHALKNESDGIRELAVIALADLPISSGKRVAALKLALADKDSKIRRRAARALAEQGPSAQTSLTELTAGLTDPDASVRRDCAGALSRLGPAAHPAAAALLTLLSEPDGRTRAVTLVALRRIGRGSIPALLNGLQSTMAETRTHCAALLGRLAPGDTFVGGLLRPLLNDPDAEVRASAAEALQDCTATPVGSVAVVRNELPAMV